MSLVVVSNRVARTQSSEPMTGGLASALLPVVRDTGAIWIGSSGRVRDDSHKESFAEIEALGAGAVATVDMPATHYRGYYEGFANSALWPALHSRPDLIRVTEEDYKSYRAINAFMARALLRFAQPETTYWVQDYHFLTLAVELRKLGINQPTGFFLHTPWSGRTTMLSVPHHRELFPAMLAYDLIGFQTDDDRQNFEEYLRHELGLSVLNGIVASEFGRTRLATFPIGIDVDDFAARALRASTRPDVSRLRTSLQGKLALGVDRLDYSKGITNRMQAFDKVLQAEPGWARRISLLQIAVPSRGRIPAYGELKKEIATLVGEINGRHADVDWAPIRYLNKSFAQSTLAGFYRLAHIGLVTPLYDGMNLVAKEYVAAQDAADPGVLILSEFAGAAKELDAALLVNPHDIDSMSQNISRAIVMSADERRARWESMNAKIRKRPVQAWFADFVSALGQVRRGAQRPAAASVSRLPVPFSRDKRSTAITG
ncbi:MAG TPA: trehalose-6-phosphate synthase [Xanthobacteraceae bacterium]|nr:trehalose-6-phosphate synthase [Xanthobacteraceae bacterium]